MKHQTLLECPICKRKVNQFETLPGAGIRDTLYPFIQALCAGWTADSFICIPCLNHVRGQFVEKNLENERGVLSESEQEVIDAIRNHELVSENPIESYSENLTFGQKMADRIAIFGGSWTFIISFAFILVAWIAMNIGIVLHHPFDPYPFILLNLVLSSLAALQAPIIMMSQNRQAARDRHDAELDFKTNLKAELEIRHLNIKIDQLLSQQWHRLLAIQQVQTDLLRDLIDRKHNEVGEEK